MRLGHTAAAAATARTWRGAAVANAACAAARPSSIAAQHALSAATAAAACAGYATAATQQPQRRSHSAAARSCIHAAAAPIGRAHTRGFHAYRTTLSEKKRDYYEVLGVPRTADKKEIKKAFYAKAKQFHPDTNKAADAAAKFAEVNNAHEILSDPEKRKRYDMMGHDAEQMGGPGGPGGPGFNAEDVFRDWFGGMGGQGGMGGGGPGGFGGFGGMGGMGGGDAGPARGADTETTINLTFMEAVTGTSRTLNVLLDAACGTCSGTGAKPKSAVTTCTDCAGKGSIRVNQGFFTVQMPCGGCGGRGKRQPPCLTCSGDGVVKQRQSVEVTVPAGADGQTVLRLSGQGNAGRMNGPRGNIFIKLNVGSHPLFKRDGFDIHYEASISMAQAALGTSIPVPTLTGDVLLTVAPGTQPGEKRVMRGKGVKMLNRPSHFGDQYVHFKVVVPPPAKLGRKARELLEQYAREQGEQVNWTTPNPAMAKEEAPKRDASAATASATPADAAATNASSSTADPAAAAAAASSASAADASHSDAASDKDETKKKKKGILGSLFK